MNTAIYNYHSVQPVFAGAGQVMGLPTTWFGLAFTLLVSLGWLMSLPLALVNPVIIAFRDASIRFKITNFACWGLSLVPLLAGISYAIATPDAIMGENWSLIFDIYQIAFPFITICQFSFLVSKRKPK